MNWTEVEAAIELLSAKISVHPDMIVAVLRGGAVPARLLASKLQVRAMQALAIDKQQTPQIMTQVLEDLAGKRILLIEDALETGASLTVAQQYLESLGAVVASAALYVKTTSRMTPDFYLEKIDTLPLFPWE